MTVFLGRPEEHDSLSSSLSKAAQLKRGSGNASLNRRNGLGAGFVMVEPLASADPQTRILSDPVVPPARRICQGCQTQLEAVEGTCPGCQQPFVFRPSMLNGNCIGNQYEVRGAMAFGAMGWIYLAWDQILSRWVVLKALMHQTDEASIAMAVAERKYLAAVKHPNIVSIYNFARHGEIGFIVMEYIGGKTLKELREERGVLPVPEAIAYILRILPAFSYLHSLRMVYCDFKLENFMIEEAEVKLIDMGCVRRLEDRVTPVYGTRGYSAPEASQEPSFSSDLYSVGRTLAIMVGAFDLFGKYQESLPEAKAVPAFAQFPALYAFLQKATHAEPFRRFQSADEMADQLLGVLRESTAGTNPIAHFESNYFSRSQSFVITAGDLATFQKNPLHFLPQQKPDASDSGSIDINLTRNLAGDSRLQALRQAHEKNPASNEILRQLAQIHISLGEYSVAERLIEETAGRDPYGWRHHWYRAVIAVAGGECREALGMLETVAAELPGEIAPRYAIALLAELLEEWSLAAQRYRVVAQVDPSMVSATLAFARCMRRLGDIEVAIEAYQRVPATSQAYSEARVELVRTLINSSGRPPGISQLKQAAQTIEALRLDGDLGYAVRLEFFLATMRALESKAVEPSADTVLLGVPMEMDPLSLAVESAYRVAARHAADPKVRAQLVDQSNRIRPVSWI